MQEILWGSLALSALALSGALVALILSVRENVKKAGRSLDAINLELPDMLSAMRLATEDLEAMLAWGGKFKRALSLLGGLLKGFETLSGAFSGRKAKKESTPTPEEHHERT